MARYDCRIGAGYGLALGALTNVEDIQPTGEKKIYAPQGFGHYVSGIDEIRSDGTIGDLGFAYTEWHWTGQPGGWITYGQARGISTTFFGGNRSAKLTIYTKTTNAAAYERYNCIGWIPQIPDRQPNFKIFTGFFIRFTRMVAL